MWTCPKCKIEIEPGFDVCWACGTSREGDRSLEFDPEFEGIMGAEQYAEVTEEKQTQEFVTVASYWQPAEARMAQSRLEAEGIHAYLANEQTIAMDWLLANALGGIKLQVAESDLDRAQEVLASVSASKPVENTNVISQAVKQGIRADLPKQDPVATDEGQKNEPTETPDLLINRAYRAALIGLFIFVVPIHIYSVYLLLRSTRLAGEPDSRGVRRFFITLTIDLLVIFFLWLPFMIFIVTVFISLLGLLFRLV